MDCKIIWTNPAIDDLREIVSYIAVSDSKSAKRVGQDIIRTVELLQDFPLLGPKYSLSGSDRIREILSWNYRIFYRVTPAKRLVEILRIWHGSRGQPPI
ncbi:MAG: type II toxin-antitoxin system RelE/ParE family toxin [Chthoniobacterales bacterium]